MSTQTPSDTGAFLAFLAAHRRLIDAVIGRVCGWRHRSLMPDARQEVHFALWRRLRSGPAIVHAVSYVYRVAFTSALGVVRRHRPAPGRPPLHDAADEQPTLTRPGELLPQERHCYLRQVLERLAPHHARALMAYLAGLRHREIAALFGWSEPAARHRLYGALAAVRPESEEGPSGDGPGLSPRRKGRSRAGARRRAAAADGPSSRP